MNQYFQLMEKNGSAFIKIVPPKEGGKLLDIKEVLAYLEEIGYSNIDLRGLNQAVSQTEQEEEVFLGDWRGYHEQEKLKISVSGDHMLVYGRFYAPSNHGMIMEIEEIYKDLYAYGITRGIQEKAIQDFIANREYCKEFLIAKGVPPIKGKDAKIEYLFNTNPNLRPKKNEDGTVDYRQLNTINHVEAGQCLARMQKEVPGKNGIDVYGEIVPPRQVKSKKFSFSNNIEVSEDGMELYSMVTGHVSLINDKIFVADVYEVPADVDNTTGNISYDGNVSVKGNVKSGFKIVAKGDIVVEGVVEGAELRAGGQIILKRGVHGMSKAVLHAEGNILTKFIESATISSNGYIETECILHSNVSARTDIRVGGKKGFITGGVVRAGSVIEARMIGSAMGGSTRVEVGVEPRIKERFMDLQKEMQQVSKDMEKLRPILENYTKKVTRKEEITPAKQKQIQVTARNFKEKQECLAAMQKEYSALGERIAMSTGSRIKVHGTIHAGVSVGISDASINLKGEYNHSQIYKDKGEIVIRPL